VKERKWEIKKKRQRRKKEKENEPRESCSIR